MTPTEFILIAMYGCICGVVSFGIGIWFALRFRGGK